MKTILTIIFIISFILVLDFCSLSYFKNETAYFEDEIFITINHIDKKEYNSANEKIQMLRKHWNKNKIIWNMLCDHSEIEKISIELNSAVLAFEHEEYYDCILYLGNLNLALEFTGERYALLIDNIS